MAGRRRRRRGEACTEGPPLPVPPLPESRCGDDGCSQCCLIDSELKHQVFVRFVKLMELFFILLMLIIIIVISVSIVNVIIIFIILIYAIIIIVIIINIIISCNN